MSVFHENMLIGASGQVAAGGISRSLRFNSADSAYLSRTPASAGNRKTWTWAGWVKKSGLAAFQTLFANASGTSDTTYFVLSLGRSSDDPLYVSLWNVNLLVTTQVFRDPSAWYHIVFAFDATQGTNANKAKLYINGSEVTAFATDNRSSISNQDYAINAAAQHTIGGQASNYYLNGYLADIYFIDGQALDPTSFGETDATTGVWVPKAYTGSYGTNGFKLTFSDNSGTTSTTLGKDAAGSNNWSPNNFSVASGSGNDSLVDTPTSYGTGNSGGDVRGNYCTWNPLDNNSQTLANGNLDVTGSLDAGSVNGTIAVSSGKYYWEVTASASGGDIVGIWSTSSRATNYPGATADSYGYNQFNGQKYNNGSASAYGATFSSGDVIGVALDMDAGTLVFYKNGVSQGTAFSSLTGSFRPSVRAGYTSNPSAGTFGNFGQRPFAYTAPSGFKALCTANLPAPLVTKPSTVMDVALYTGNGSTQTISGLGFSPDLVWIKSRSNVSGQVWTDIVRGVGKELQSNSTAAETTDTVNFLTAFNSNGFSVGSDAAYNGSSRTYVAWTWDAGSSSASPNNDGTVTSTVKVNATAGFSIVTWTYGNAPTVGHGLGAAPSLIIAKSRTVAVDWVVYHRSLGKDKLLVLNDTGAEISSSNYWGSSEPSSTVFGTIGNNTNSNNRGDMVAYCFAPVVGYSSMGSFVGNGSSDGVFVYTGFRPRFLLTKRTDSAESWIIHDTARNSYNVANLRLRPNSSDAEVTVTTVDILSNGFKLRTGTSGAGNDSGATYIYFAVAESPFQYARAR